MSHLVSLADLTWREAEDVFGKKPLALLPIGAVEAHGPHLPLYTDVLLSQELSERLAKALAPKPVVILPPVNYAVTNYAAEFSGTVSLSPQTAHGLLSDILRSVGRHGVEFVALVNSHLEPAHINVLEEVAQDFLERPHVIFTNHCRKPLAQRLSPEFQSGDCHAGSYETSLLLASRYANLVKKDKMKTLPPVKLGLVKQMKQGVATFGAMGANDAYFGEPAVSSPEHGEILWSTLVELWVEAIKAEMGG
jgi:creatinine amidohydrolase